MYVLIKFHRSTKTMSYICRVKRVSESTSLHILLKCTQMDLRNYTLHMYSLTVLFDIVNTIRLCKCKQACVTIIIQETILLWPRKGVVTFVVMKLGVFLMAFKLIFSNYTLHIYNFTPSPFNTDIYVYIQNSYS